MSEEEGCILVKTCVSVSSSFYCTEGIGSKNVRRSVNVLHKTATLVTEVVHHSSSQGDT